MELCSNRIQSDLYTRRDMLRGLSCGFGMLGFSQLAFGQGLLDGANPLTTRHASRSDGEASHFPVYGRCASHVDTFDYKPELSRLDGQRGNRNRRLLGSPSNSSSMAKAVSHQRTVSERGPARGSSVCAQWHAH